MWEPQFIVDYKPGAAVKNDRPFLGRRDANLKLMRGFRLAILFAGSFLIASAQVIGDVREAIALHDFARGDKYIQNYRAKSGVTPEFLEALSWLGRGALEDKKYD